MPLGQGALQQTGGVVLDESDEMLAVLSGDDKVFEAAVADAVGLVNVADKVDVEEGCSLVCQLL